MKCQTVLIKRRRVCYGDLNRKIILHVRSIDTPDTLTDYDYGQNLTTPKSVWSAIQTLTGKEIFDGVNLIGTATHVFYIKHVKDLTSESFLEYNTEYYRILRLENLDSNNEYMALFCALRGALTAGVNIQ